MGNNIKPIRLPPLDALRVKTPRRKVPNPCTAVLSSLLACWASSGLGSSGCVKVETQLRQCMDGPRAPPAELNTINYHLHRMKKYLVSPQKKK
ncbi:hypothetical protein GQ602_000467 [Ophiocordyceps camponoti-floridani]|uniref:Small ribosomal subunit protein mS37 n=1 Tax=Ophiocordyceps camponoti-floridani TaxID=2030778 RepID=A0A8H4VGA2_9HYPO|nr:hypothetical protein GQ602_000467 [Ophiocordyceps camponoti-floridani]